MCSSLVSVCPSRAHSSDSRADVWAGFRVEFVLRLMLCVLLCGESIFLVNKTDCGGEKTYGNLSAN